MAFIQNVDVVDIFFHNTWLFIKRGLTMDDSSVREYERKALLLKQNRNINQVKSIDDLIRLLLNEKEIENFIYEIEHLGDSVDSRVLGLANLIGESIFTLPQMLKLLEQIKLSQQIK